MLTGSFRARVIWPRSVSLRKAVSLSPGSGWLGWGSLRPVWRMGGRHRIIPAQGKAWLWTSGRKNLPLWTWIGKERSSTRLVWFCFHLGVSLTWLELNCLYLCHTPLLVLCSWVHFFLSWDFDVSSPLKKGPRLIVLTGKSFREELQ